MSELSKCAMRMRNITNTVECGRLMRLNLNFALLSNEFFSNSQLNIRIVQVRNAHAFEYQIDKLTQFRPLTSDEPNFVL